MPLNATSVWTHDAPPRRTATEVSELKPLNNSALWMIMAMAALSILIVCQSLYSLHSEIVHLRHAGITDSKVLTPLLQTATRWILIEAFVGLICGIASCILLIRHAENLRVRWLIPFSDHISRTDIQYQRLLAELADATVGREEAVASQRSMAEKLASESQKRAELERALETYRSAERTLGDKYARLEQTRNLLELNVQARNVELEKLQKRNELILNSAGDGICGFDLTNKATFANPAVARMTGWSLTELSGMSETELFASGAEGAEGKCATPGEQWILRKDGSSFPAECVRTPIRENDREVGTVVIIKDITERKETEKRLTQKAEELARSNRELEQFAFVASHDLQEPLRKIQAFGDRLKEKCGGVQFKDARDYLERMQNAAARMQTLIKDLLMFSRVLSSSQPFIPVDLSKIAQEVLGDLEFRVEKTAAKIYLGNLPCIPADPTQMRQLLQNLIGNALKFQSPGAVPEIHIEGEVLPYKAVRANETLPQPPESDVPPDEYCVLRVRDNGIGFDEQHLEKIFAVFQRLHGRSEYEGTGIGLAVCRRITDRHHGMITARSKPGAGATFIVVLPMTHPTTLEVTQ